MLRWILLLALVASIYWIYQRDYAAPPAPPPSEKAASAEPAPTREGSGRLGGGLNPFVTDTDIDAMPQRPKAP